MDAHEFEHFMARLRGLSRRQRDKVLALPSQGSRHEKEIEQVEWAATSCLHHGAGRRNASDTAGRTTCSDPMRHVR
jgi:hypothetical protein